MSRPSPVICQCGLKAVATINEDHSQPATPESSELCAGGYNGYDRAVDASLYNIAPELMKRIDGT